MAEISSNDPNPVGVGRNSGKCQLLSISLGDENATIQWDLQVEVRRGEEGFATIASFRTVAAGNGLNHPRNRIIGVCYCPGAVEWQVTPRPVRGTLQAGKDIRAELGLATDECCGAFPAVATIYAELLRP
jgi:hypothetical protein